MVTKKVLLSKISHTGDEVKNVNPFMSFNKEQNDYENMSFFRDTNKAGMIVQISTALTKGGGYVIVSPRGANVDIAKATVK
ncbi:hypothetical protein DPMN_022950 [Dreissena polymorpha]|uniref:Uncharacterized protein n=1 Tax=Dreissena polymorpha TaxID=45954 RepID=A0A9D4RAX7_DREPO|nr:hypothetical protein DPMN_022950 [Dreissena polymorpha]